MPYQHALTVAAPVRSGAADDLKALLATMGDGVANGSVVDFGALSGVHFARLMVIEEAWDHAGTYMPSYLVLLSDLDVAPATHLIELVQTAGEGIDRLFGHCEGYPAGTPAERARLEYLTRHVVRESATYVNTAGRSAQQIREEAVLRDAIQDFLDREGVGLAGADPTALRRAVLEFVEREPRLAFARRPAQRPELGERLRRLANLVGVPLVTLPFVPVALAAAPAYAVVLRRHERTDPAPHVKPDEDKVHELAELEDHLVQNPFTAIGHVKPSPFRRATLVGVMFYLDYAARHFFSRGDLAGVKTIHFARWVFLDGKKRMFFASNYDGSLEAYMDDFIDKVAWGLNLVFSNGVGYPRARWLIKDGCRDELAFKDFLRVNMVPTRVWYTAYGELTALNIQQNERIRAGLQGKLSADEAREWVQCL
jgi:hypothetical protein